MQPEIKQFESTVWPMKAGWLYLGAVMDLFTRHIIGWSMNARMTKEAFLEAL